MSDRVVNFADMAFKLRGKIYYPEKGRCQHIHVTLDDEGGIVTCDECDKQLDAYLTLRRMCEKWERHAAETESTRDGIRRDAETIIVLRAAKLIQEAWRRRNSAPTCPHCREAILPEDRFGSCTINKEMELRRRAVKRSQASGGDVNG